MGLIRDNNNEIEYISKIKIYYAYEDLNNDNINPNILNKFKEETEHSILDDVVGCNIVVVFGKYNETLAIAYVYNEHNGYYSHEVVINENDEIDIDYL